MAGSAADGRLHRDLKQGAGDVVPQLFTQPPGAGVGLLPVGDENELMLKNTLSLITTGTMPDAEKPEETETQSAKVLYNSLSRKKINGVLLR